MKKISAVIISNGQIYELRRAISCLDNQESKVDEIIIVDNSTEDLSGAFTVKSTDVQYIRVQEKFSKFQLCQIGIKEASGDYIAFLDSYDIWTEKKVNAVKELMKQDEMVDIIAHSYQQQVCTHQEKYLVSAYEQENATKMAVVQFLHAPSSVVLSRKVATCLEVININNMKSVILSEIYSEHWSGAYKNVVEMEKQFWMLCKNEINKLGLLEYGIRYCKCRFHASEDYQTMYKKMTQNAIISSKEIAFWGDIQNVIMSLLLKQKDWSIERQHQNYILMRNWLELKLCGETIAEKLIKDGIKNIAIYGAGKHGTMLFRELTSQISIKFWIDQNKKEESYLDIPIININKIKGLVEDIDAIIITPYAEYDTISTRLMDKTSARLISLWELVKE